MNVSITVCKTRDDVEKRKEQVRALAPDLDWTTRTIEAAESLSVELLHDIGRDPESIFAVPVSDLEGAPETAFILVMWVET